jgi:hypothetical protein
MKSPTRARSKEVAVRHRATSAQPPHATSLFPRWSSSLRAPHPFPSTAILDTPGVLLEGLRCFPAASPLPGTTENHRKNMVEFLGDFQ